MTQVRLLPVLMICCLLMLLFFKVNNIFVGLTTDRPDSQTSTSLVGVPSAVAQEAGEEDLLPEDDLGLEDDPFADEPGLDDPDLADAVATGGAGFGSDPTLFTQEEIDLLQNLAQRREVINDREAELDQREAFLAAAEARIDRKIDEMASLKDHIEDLIRAKEEGEEEKLSKLVKVYESMKPKQAALIWNNLEMPILLEVATRMREVKAADVMARMTPERARELTAELARREEIGSLPE
jgi:flagellar motility protein MotE (MotC chaperone)